MRKKLIHIIMFLVVTMTFLVAPSTVSASEKLVLSTDKITVGEGEYKSLKVNVNETGNKVTFKSSDKNIVTITKKGTIKGVSQGKATITVTAGKQKATCRVVVNEPSLQVSDLNQTMEIGERRQVSVIKNTCKDKITFKSSDTDIIRVSSKGSIKAVGEGRAYVRVKAGSHITRVYVTVKKQSEEDKKIYPTKIQIDDWIIDSHYEDTYQLPVEIFPEDATERKLTYTSSNEEIATITEDGVIIPTGKALGTITVTVKSENGLVDTLDFEIYSLYGMLINKVPKKEYDTTVKYKGRFLVDLGWTVEELLEQMGTPLRREVNEYQGETFVYQLESSSLVHVHVDHGFVKGYLLVGEKLEAAGFTLGESRAKIDEMITWGEETSNSLAYCTDSYDATLFLDRVDEGRLYMLYVNVPGYYYLRDGADSKNPSVSSEYTEMMINEARDIINAFRAIHGSSALVRDTMMDTVAFAHARDMCVNNYYSHINLQGQGPKERLDSAGINTNGTVAENINWMANSIVDEIHNYICSPGHRNNFLLPQCRYIGIGFDFGEEDNHSVFVLR